MKKTALIFMLFVLKLHCQSQEFKSFKFERYIIVDNGDTVRIFRLSGSLENAKPLDYEYHIMLYNSYGRYFKMDPAISFLDSIHFNHYNIRMSGRYTDFREIRIFRIPRTDNRSIGFLRRLDYSGFDETELAGIRKRIRFEFLPNSYRIDFKDVF